MVATMRTTTFCLLIIKELNLFGCLAVRLRGMLVFYPTMRHSGLIFIRFQNLSGLNNKHLTCLRKKKKDAVRDRRESVSSPTFHWQHEEETEESFGRRSCVHQTYLRDVLYPLWNQHFQLPSDWNWPKHWYGLFHILSTVFILLFVLWTMFFFLSDLMLSHLFFFPPC